MRLTPHPVFALALCALVAGQNPPTEQPPEGHSHRSHVFNEGPRQAAYLMAGTGAVHFPVRTVDPLAQRYFDQGIGQLHGFWYFEAERSFRQVALLDPDCALAYWGMCMANVNNKKRARGLIAQAYSRRRHATARGRMWIDAYARFYLVDKKNVAGLLDPDDKKTKAPKRNEKKLARELIRDLERIAFRYPNDIEAKAFLANRIWLNQGRLQIPSHFAVHSLQEAIFAKDPRHPTHHYRIHLWDREDAARALESAARIGPSAPGIAHMWHMGGHIYAKLNRHADAAWQQEASARVDHAHMMRDRVMPYKIHNYGHNNEWTCRSLQHVGRTTEALALARNMLGQPRHPKDNRLDRGSSIAGYGRRRLIETLETFELWPELRTELTTGLLAQPPVVSTDQGADGKVDTPEAKRKRQRLALLAKAAFRAGDVEAGQRALADWNVHVADLRQRRQNDADAAEAKARREGKKEADVLASMTAALKKHEPLMRSVHQSTQKLEVEAQLAKHDLDGAWKAIEATKATDSLLAFEVRYRQFLHSRQSANADPKRQRELTTALRKFAQREDTKNPGRVPQRVRLLLALDAGDQTEELRDAFEDFRRLAGKADLDTPLLRRLEPIAQRLGLPTDWRVEAAPAVDLGARPPLASLGPFRWQSPTAPELTVPTTDGNFSLADYRGRPVLVIFFLGMGCVHCVEQLQAMVPRHEDFRAAGIEVVAIGTDTLEQLRTATLPAEGDAAEEPYPFRLAADPTHRAFRQYRAFDDFEGLALHGTFLIDGNGKIRWQDIGYEPFMDVDFLLAESHRLLRTATTRATAGSR